MPPPSLSTTTMRRSAPRRAQRGERAGVVEEGDVADEGDGRRPAEGDAEGGRHHAVDAVGAAVGVGDRRRPAEPLEVADRHRRGDDEPGAVRETARRRRGRRRARSARASAAERRRRSPARRSAARIDPVGGQPVGARLRDGELGEGAERRRREVDGDAVVGVDHAGPTDLHDGRRAAGDPLASTFDAAGRPTRTTTSGRWAAANSLDAQHRVEGRDRAVRAGDSPTSGRRAPASPSPSASVVDVVGRPRRCAHRRGSAHARPSAARRCRPGTSAVVDVAVDRDGTSARRQLADRRRGAARGTAG